MRIYMYVMFVIVQGLYTQSLDSTYIRLYKHNLIINPWIGVPQYDIQVSGAADTAIRYNDYVSNTRVLVGVDLTYRDLSISLGLKTKLYTNDEQQFGKSKAASLSMRYTHKKWAFEGRYGNYSGFADATNYQNAKEILPFRKDLNVYMLRLASTYTFKAHKFSYGAAFNYSYRQLRSAWSPLLMAHAYRLGFNANASVLDTNIMTADKHRSRFNKARNLGIGLGPGIGGTFIAFKRFFFTGMLCIGADLQNNKLTKDNTKVYKSITAHPFVDFRMAIGYNINRLFAAMTLKNENLILDMYKFDIAQSYSILTFELGYRFDAPRWLHKSYGKVMSRNKTNTRDSSHL